MKRPRFKVGIDLGNSFVKGVYKNEEGIIIRKKLPNKFKINKTINTKAKYFERKDSATGGVYLGVGNLNNNVLKFSRKYLLEQTLVMIDLLLPNENMVEIDLRLGLPPAQLFNENHLNEFEKNFVIGEEHEFFVNGSFKKVKFESVVVCAEGYSGFVALANEMPIKDKILSIDVGGGTTDLCSYEYDYDDEIYYPDETHTIFSGIIPFSEVIAESFNQQHGGDIKPDFINHILKENLETFEYNNAEYKIEQYIKAIEPMVDDIVNQITNKYGKLESYCIVGLGGGFKVFDMIAKDKIFSRIDITPDNQFYANAEGFIEQ